MIPTYESLELLREISSKMEGTTFHHHSHLLYDIPIRENGYYVEIGCYAGATACLMLHKANVVSIDLGRPISSTIVYDNVDMFNHKKNSFTYLEGNSQSNEMVKRLKEITNEIDILFIDGDHTKEGVMNDFLLYHEMVIPGGYIVFDDYNDDEFSPEVKPTVNMIVKNFLQYEVIGTFENTLGARPRFLTEANEGNCFVMRKK